MKKKILILLLLTLIVAGCGKKKEVEKPKLTLDTMAELINNKYAMPKIKCSALSKYSVIGSFSDKLLLSDGHVYNFGSLYSNNEQCMRDSNAQGEFKKVIEGGFLVGTDNKLYSTYDYKQNTYTTNIASAGYVNWVEIKMTEAEEKQYPQTSSYKNGSSTSYKYAKYYALKSDGSIYTILFKVKSVRKNNKETKTASIVYDKLLYSSAEYGKITDFAVNNSTYKEVNMIISEKGLYTLTLIETEDCMKYEDIACQTKMTLVEDYSYNKYANEIKYYDKNFVITRNNSILSTNLVFNLNGSRKTYERLFADYQE